MEKKYFCKKASEFNLESLELDDVSRKVVDDFIHQLGVEEFVHMLRLEDTDCVFGNYVYSNRRVRSVLDCVTITESISRWDAKDILDPIKEWMKAKGFIRRGIFRTSYQLIGFMHVLHYHAKYYLHDNERVMTSIDDAWPIFKEKEESFVVYLLNLTNEQYESYDEDTLSRGFAEIFAERLSPMQAELIDWLQERSIDVPALSSLETDLLSAAIINVAKDIPLLCRALEWR